MWWNPSMGEEQNQMEDRSCDCSYHKIQFQEFENLGKWENEIVLNLPEQFLTFYFLSWWGTLFHPKPEEAGHLLTKANILIKEIFCQKSTISKVSLWIVFSFFPVSWLDSLLTYFYFRKGNKAFYISLLRKSNISKTLGTSRKEDLVNDLRMIANNT